MKKFDTKPEIAQKRREEIGERVTQFYENMGLSRPEFVAVLGVEYDTLRSYERGKSEPGSSFFEKLREKYPASDIGWIITGKRTVVEGMENVDPIPLRKIPVVDSLPSGGFLQGIPEESVINSIYTTELKNPSVFALLVRTGSMMPDIKEGDYAVLLPVKKAQEGKMYLVSAGNKPFMLGKVFRNEKGFMLIPSNSSLQSVVLGARDEVSFYELVEISRRFV